MEFSVPERSVSFISPCSPQIITKSASYCPCHFWSSSVIYFPQITLSNSTSGTLHGRGCTTRCRWHKSTFPPKSLHQQASSPECGLWDARQHQWNDLTGLLMMLPSKWGRPVQLYRFTAFCTSAHLWKNRNPGENLPVRSSQERYIMRKRLSQISQIQFKTVLSIHQNLPFKWSYYFKSYAITVPTSVNN